jgi:hypothetical protein
LQDEQKYVREFTDGQEFDIKILAVIMEGRMSEKTI